MANENLNVTFSRPYRKALTNNNNDSAFASRVPTITEPTNDGVIDVGWQRGVNANGTVPQWLQILPYGLGSDNDVFDMKVIGWRHLGSLSASETTRALWVPTTIAVFTCTLSTGVGVAGSQVLNTERFCDTITVKSTTFQPLQTNVNATPAAEYSGNFVLTYSPADQTMGWIVLLLLGFEKVEFTFDQTTGTPTMNALVALF